MLVRVDGGESRRNSFGCSVMSNLLVVVGDLDVVSISVLPGEAEAPLVIDADAVVPPTVALKFLEAMGGRYA